MGLAQQGPYKVSERPARSAAQAASTTFMRIRGTTAVCSAHGFVRAASRFSSGYARARGEIADANARGVAVDPKDHHGFATSKPVVMWDTKT